MTQYEELLRLIETVDPSDTEKLDEIDARVWSYLELQGDFKISFGSGGSVHYRHNDWPSHAHTILHHRFQHPQYTRSLDAIESIMPKGWWIESCKIFDGTYIAELHDDRGCNDDDEGITVKAWYRQNEKLARLHAVIQAIQYERENGK